jgi:hypothetical protein
MMGKIDMKDAAIMRGMALDYRRQAESAEDAGWRRRFTEWAVYCERMAIAMEARLRGRG